jgi:flavin reductase (DIM6/NTAB) family NADH-FMN oxidoreductase RutF
MGSSEELAREFKALEACLDRELWVVTAADADGPGGLIATFVSTASIVPEMPRMLVGIGKRHATWKKIEASGALALHLFGPSRIGWLLGFAAPSNRRSKLEGLDHRPGPSGSPILAEALGWLDCRVEARLDTGDRTVYLGEVIDARAPSPNAEPVLTARKAFEMIPEGVRGVLRGLLFRDALLDAEAIRAWRQSRSSGEVPEDPFPPNPNREGS